MVWLNCYISQKMKSTTMTVSVVLIILFSEIYCHTHATVQNLYSHLLTNYSKRIMPLADHSQQLDVGVDFYLNSFISINEVDKTISIIGSILLNWTDPALKLEFWSFDNLLYIIIDPSDIWTPLIFLANSAEQIEPIGNRVVVCFLL